MEDIEKEIKTDHFKTMEELLKHLKIWEENGDYDAYYRFFCPRCAYELAHEIEKQQKEIEELEEDNNTLEMMINTANEREYRKKYIEERRKEQPNLYCPDFDEIYERYYKQKAKIEQLKEDYQILKDDIEGHNIVYVDTPEFEEKYISKDKIKEQIRMVEETKRKGKGIDNYSMHYCIMRLKELLGE